MRATFFSLPARGHVNPTLPLVEALAAQGEEIIYYATEEFRAEIERAGCTFRRYQRLSSPVTHLYSASIFRTAEILLDVTSELLPSVLDHLRGERPGYIFYDMMAAWGWVAARLLDLPTVSSIPTFALNKEVGRAMMQASGMSPLTLVRAQLLTGFSLFNIWRKARRLERRYGVELLERGILDIFSSRADLNLVYTSREFQPLSETFDASYRFVGPSIPDELPETDFPLERLEGRKVLYVSLGTVRNRRPDFYRACLEAYGGGEFLVVMAVGRGTEVASLGALPDNVIVREYVPQLAILKRAELFLTHAGMNSVQEALYFGVPMMLYPQTGEQRFVAQRVVEVGAGELLPGSVTPEGLRRAAQRVAGEPAYRSAARRIGESLRAAGGYARAVREVREGLVHVTAAGPKQD